MCRRAPAGPPTGNVRTGHDPLSTRPDRPAGRRWLRERTLERRLFGWTLALTLGPALVLVVAGAWAVSSALGVAGALGPWEEVAESGRRVVELAEPGADPALSEALAAHRAELSESLTQARRWAFLGQRFQEVLPWLVLALAVALAGLAAVASRRLARQLARPIHELVTVADRMGRGEALPAPARRSVREVEAVDHALRQAADQLGRAREQAVSAERLRVWGEMARRVAHEMKNPLTPLRLAAHRLARQGAGAGAANAGPVAEVAEVIDQEVGRLEELAAQFSALGRPPEGPPTPVDLDDLVRGLLETDVPAGVALELDLPQGLPPVQGHYDALVRAFRNLIRNALEAMESEPEPRLRVGVAPAGGTAGAPGWIEVGITDNGGGLPVDGAHLIFEPDFTTKTRGTGLGLALVRQAVEADGGTIEATNRDDGAHFVVRLPVAGPPGPVQ
jgi:nitrogen fixation/metabolism regulation signal transduction histidine kinase